jgi:hypothetical protein
VNFEMTSKKQLSITKIVIQRRIFAYRYYCHYNAPPFSDYASCWATKELWLNFRQQQQNPCNLLLEVGKPIL